MILISELQNGDELICYMRQGLALEVGVTGKASPYRYVPKKPQKAGSRALTRFTGIVINNDPDTGVLTVQTARMSSQKINHDREQSLVASIHYTAFSRVQRISEVHSEPYNRYGGRPTKYEGLGTARKPYRTLEDIRIIWEG